MRILVVDDSSEFRRLLRSMLVDAGESEVVVAGSAQEAFRVLAAGPVDLLILDLMMPDVDGLGACRIVRGFESMRDVPIIVVTADTAPRTLEAAFTAGASDFIAKPFQRIELLARVRAALALKEERDRRRKREAELVEMQSKLEVANAELLRLSAVDPLTGIANRRTFDQAASREWRRAVREDARLSVCLLDVDFFKMFNDRYGHQGGDECLRQVAGALARTLRRPADLVARYGGEEFGVLLPGTHERGALLVAQSLRAAVEALDLLHEGSSVAKHVTVSVGVATAMARRGEDVTALIEAADRALYQAKREGRNCVRVDAPATQALTSTLSPGDPAEQRHETSAASA